MNMQEYSIESESFFIRETSTFLEINSRNPTSSFIEVNLNIVVADLKIKSERKFTISKPGMGKSKPISFAPQLFETYLEATIDKFSGNEIVRAKKR